jgi:hypothetical protein
MARTRIRRFLKVMVLAACALALPLSTGRAQSANGGPASASSPTFVTIEQPDAQRTRAELSQLLQRYPPSLPGTLALDPSLLVNQSYLAPYPALVDFLNKHPEIVRNPSFFVGEGSGPRAPIDRDEQRLRLWQDVLAGLAALTGFAIALSVLVWLTRTVIDYRRWSRLASVQTDVHTKILDRFTANDDLLAYIKSPAGSKFLESSPIKLDAGPRSVGAPLSRILWSVQGGLVLLAGGIGLGVMSGRVANRAAEPIQGLGILAIALGLGFIGSAAVSFFISRKLGLIDAPPQPARTDLPAVGELGERK